MAAIDSDTLCRLVGYDAAPSAGTQTLPVAERAADGCVIEDLLIQVTGSEPIPAYLTRPELGKGPCPAVLYCHAHGNRHDIGRQELLDGRPALLDPPYGLLLAQRGFVTLCLEMPGFGARAAPSESALSKALLWQGRTLFGQMLQELSLGLGYLVGRQDVDGARIAAIGLSMGGTHAYWLAALDRRVRAVAQLCCFADLAGLIRTGAHDLHGQYMTVPGLLRHGDAGDVAGLVAPRPQLICVGLEDPLTPRPAFEGALTRAFSSYREHGAAAHLEIVADTAGGHAETPEMRRSVLDFLARTLA